MREIESMLDDDIQNTIKCQTQWQETKACVFAVWERWFTIETESFGQSNDCMHWTFLKQIFVYLYAWLATESSDVTSKPSQMSYHFEMHYYYYYYYSYFVPQDFKAQQSPLFNQT